MGETLSENSSEIPVGAPVHTSDGEYLGLVVSISRHVVVVERGWLDRRGYAVPITDVVRVHNGVVELRRTLADITVQGKFRER